MYTSKTKASKRQAKGKQMGTQFLHIEIKRPLQFPPPPPPPSPPAAVTLPPPDDRGGASGEGSPPRR
jgi:hypothetical protein